MKYFLLICILSCLPLGANAQEKDASQLFQEVVGHLELAENIKVIGVFKESLRVQLSYQADGKTTDAQLDFHTVLPPSWAKRANHYEVNVPFVGQEPNRAKLQFKDRTQSVLCYRSITDLAAQFGSVDPNAVSPSIKQ